MTTVAQQLAAVVAVGHELVSDRVPYLWDGKNAAVGLDCSGATSWEYLHGAGVTLGAGTAGQLSNGIPVIPNGSNRAWPVVLPLLQLADLVFPSTGHVQLYAGGGMVIEEAEPGTVATYRTQWATTVYAVRRVLIAPSAPPSAPQWPGRYLRLETPLMTGSDVATWQRALIAAGHSCGPSGADGIFGNNTNSATLAWAAAKGIPVSTEPQIVGPDDWSVMFG